MRKNPTFDRRVGEGFGYDARSSRQGGAHARRRSSASRDVELHCAGAASPPGPSSAPDPGDGTRRGPWPSLKSSTRRGAPAGPPPADPGNPTVDFHGERRSNVTHVSTTDPDARLARKGKGHEAKLAYQGHVLMENRHGLAVEGCVTRASGYGERAAALEMVGHRATSGRVTVGADKGYDSRDFVEALRLLQVTPHVAQNTSNRSSAIDQRTTRHAGYGVSQWKRKRVEEIFGWLKTVGLLRKTRHRGRRRVSWMFIFGLAVYNLVRIRNLAEATG